MGGGWTHRQYRRSTYDLLGALRMYSTTSAGIDAGTLREQLTGAVTVPGDAGWDEARQAWNLAVDQRPAAVAEPETVADVVAIVKFARERGIRVAAQGTGHAATALAEDAPARHHPRQDTPHARRRDRSRQPPRRRPGRRAVGRRRRPRQRARARRAGRLVAPADVGVVGYCLGGGLSCSPQAWPRSQQRRRRADRDRGRPRRGRRRQPRSRPLLGRARRRGQLRHRHRHRARALPRRRPLRRHARLPCRARRGDPARLARVGAHGSRRGDLGRARAALPAARGHPGAGARAVLRRGRDGLPRRRGIRVGAARPAARAGSRDGHVRARDPGRPAPAAHGPASRRACRRRRCAARRRPR